MVHLHKSMRGVLVGVCLLSSLGTPVIAQDVRQIPSNPTAIVVDQELNFPCWYCLAVVSRGAGRFAATSSIMDLHVISNKFDVAFPRALVARIESECEFCQPAAVTAQARGMNARSTVWAANLEAYSLGRASVAELNIGAALGGYVIDVAPVRLPDGNASNIDAVLKVEGFKYDPGAAKIGSYIEAKINPQTALVVLPADQGPVTLFATADGRMREVWSKGPDDAWHREVIVDGATQDADNRISILEARIAALSEVLNRFALGMGP